MLTQILTILRDQAWQGISSITAIIALLISLRTSYQQKQQQTQVDQLQQRAGGQPLPPSASSIPCLYRGLIYLALLTLVIYLIIVFSPFFQR